MREGLLYLFSSRAPLDVLRDVFDIFIVAYIVYRALLILRGTRAIQMGIGLLIVFLVYLAAKLFQFVTLLNLLSWLLSSIILVVVVVFQNDIRRALIRMGGKAWLSGGREQQSRVIDEVVAAATELARHRMGAIIAFEQDANMLEFCKSEGIAIESVVTRELLVSLFVPESVNKLHDGAVLIRDLKIARAGVFFPMPETKILDASLGSRHRAALGITEETDAVVVVVSEERGTISFCFSGNIVSNLDGQSLRHALLGLFGRSARKKSGRKAPVSARPASAGVTPRPSVATPPGETPARLPGALTPVSIKSPSHGKVVVPPSTRQPPQPEPSERGVAKSVEMPPASTVAGSAAAGGATKPSASFVPAGGASPTTPPPSTRSPMPSTRPEGDRPDDAPARGEDS